MVYGIEDPLETTSLGGKYSRSVATGAGCVRKGGLEQNMRDVS